MHVEGLDINLLVPLHALLTERHVTRAAARVGLTQPAMSHALARLRHVLKDPILVRGRHGMMLTARARDLAGPVERVLADVAKVFEPASPFEPGEARRTFRIGTTDYVEFVLVPQLLELVREQAPHVNVRLLPLAGDGSEALGNDVVDVVIGPSGAVAGRGNGLVAQRVLEDRFVCVVREDHPTVGKRLSLEGFLALPHALVTPRGDPSGYVDTALAALGKRRRIVVSTPHFLVAPFLVRTSDVILTLAARIARALAPVAGLRILELPSALNLDGFDISVLSHERSRTDAAHSWLRATIASAAKMRARIDGAGA